MKEEREKYLQELTKEQEEKIKLEKEKLDKELKDIFKSSGDIDVQTALDMPANYERFHFTFEINKFSFTIATGGEKYTCNKMAELSITQIAVNLNH